jgi:ABC-type Fe3+-hydroxamate transport system substrate-binding protein
MRKIIVFVIALLFYVGCTNNSKHTTNQVTQNDSSNSILINEPKGKMIEFKETSTLGRGDHIEVNQIVKVGPNHSQYKRLKGKPVWVTIGWISKSRDGMYRYYEPLTNELNPTFTETDLDILKEKIKSHHSKF